MTPQIIRQLDDPRVADYRNVKDAALRLERGLFLAEGRTVVRRLLVESPYPARSVFCTPAAQAALADALKEVGDTTPVYLAENDVFAQIIGFGMHRGCLASAARPPEESVAGLLAALRARLATRRDGAPARVVVLDDLADHDNVGAIFRNARAFGVDAVLLSQRCCDPLYRKAIRTSMGAALCLPFARVTDWAPALDRLRAEGFAVWALDPGSGACALQERIARGVPARLALVLGCEGPGLSEALLAAADERVCVEMDPGMDSVNVATAAALALYALQPRLLGGGAEAARW